MNQPTNPVAEAAPNTLIDAPAPLAAAVASRPPRSLFWRVRAYELHLAELNLLAAQGVKTSVDALKGGLDGIAERVGQVQFPATLSVQTTRSAADAAVEERKATAAEEIADAIESRFEDSCAGVASLSPAAYALIARITALAAHLMDRSDVTAQSTLDHFDRDAGLIGEVSELLWQRQLDDGVQVLARVYQREPFASLAGDPATNCAPEVYAELQRRAALLLSLKCLVATRIGEGEAPDWPPQPCDDTDPGNPGATRLRRRPKTP